MKINNIKFCFFSLLLLSSCYQNNENLKKVSEAELTKVILKNNGFVDVKGNYVDEKGNKITMDSIIKLESNRDLSYTLDFYKNSKNEIILAKLRRSNFKDSLFVKKINEIIQDFIVVSLAIDCKNAEKELIEIINKDQEIRKNSNDASVNHYNTNFVVNLIEKCDKTLISKFSKEARYGIWLTLQHSPPKIIKKYFPILLKYNEDVFKFEEEMLQIGRASCRERVLVAV